jgi:hypothetical protein
VLATDAVDTDEAGDNVAGDAVPAEDNTSERSNGGSKKSSENDPLVGEATMPFGISDTAGLRMIAGDGSN